MATVIQPTGIIEAPLTVVERLAKRFVIEPSGCWSWTGHRDSWGYGVFSVRGAGRRAHRVVWELTKGKVDVTLQIDHLCRNRACVNPEHLELVTARVNALRSHMFRTLKTHCKRGHEFTPENSCWRWSEYYKSRQRTCRACLNARVAKWRSNKKILEAHI